MVARLRCIIMEYAPDGDIRKIIQKAQTTKKPTPEDQVRTHAHACTRTHLWCPAVLAPLVQLDPPSLLKHGTRACACSTPQVWRIIIQIVRGLEALHSLKIIHRPVGRSGTKHGTRKCTQPLGACAQSASLHVCLKHVKPDSAVTTTPCPYAHARRDIKPGNIMLMPRDVVKIGDLGVAKLLKHSALTNTQIGTPYYMAPEIWANRCAQCARACVQVLRVLAR